MLLNELTFSSIIQTPRPDLRGLRRLKWIFSIIRDLKLKGENLRLDKEFLLYLLYRGLSSFFFVVAIYTVMLAEEFNLMLMSLYSSLALFFMFRYTTLKPIPQQTRCLDDLPALAGSFLSTFLMIGYGICVLGLYMTLLSKKIPIEVVTYSFAFFVANAILYIYFCKKRGNSL